MMGVRKRKMPTGWEVQFRITSIDIWHTAELPASKSGELLIAEDVAGGIWYFLVPNGRGGWLYGEGDGLAQKSASVSTTGTEWTPYVRRWMRLRRPNENLPT